MMTIKEFSYKVMTNAHMVLSTRSDVLKMVEMCKTKIVQKVTIGQDIILHKCIWFFNSLSLTVMNVTL